MNATWTVKNLPLGYTCQILHIVTMTRMFLDGLFHVNMIFEVKLCHEADQIRVEVKVHQLLKQ